MSVRRYVVVIEQGTTSWGAYVPDVPGCVAVGESRDEVEQLIREGLELHLENLQEHGDPLPEAQLRAAFVDEVDIPLAAA